MSGQIDERYITSLNLRLEIDENFDPGKVTRNVSQPAREKRVTRGFHIATENELQTGRRSPCRVNNLAVNQCYYRNVELFKLYTILVMRLEGASPGRMQNKKDLAGAR